MRSLLILILSSTLLACTKADLDPSFSLTPAPRRSTAAADDSLVTQDVTDRTICVGPVAVPSSLPGSTWQLNYSFNNGATVDQYISFGEDFMVVENNCQWRHQTKTARVKVPIHLENNFFEIKAGDTSEEVIRSQKEEFFCVADVPTDQVKFSFVGKCLRFDFPNKAIILVPLEPNRLDQ